MLKIIEDDKKTTNKGVEMKQFAVYSLVLLLCPFLTLPLQAQFRADSRQYENLRVNNDSTTEVQNEQQIVMNPADSTNLVAVWRDFRFGYRQVYYGYTFDDGRTWQQDRYVEPQYNWDSDPGLTVDDAGNFYSVILSYNSTSESNGLFVYRSTDGGASWSGPFTVINNVPGVFEDKELIACDRSSGPYAGNLYVAWARFYSTQILLSRSSDAGSTFVGPVQVSDYSGVQWPVPCVGSNSEVYVAWVDYTPGSILFDRSTNGGQSFGSDITVQNTSFVQGYINGGITVFSFPAMDVDITGGPNNGTIYIAYMDDASGYTDTDIYFTKSTDGGNTWTSRVRINDDAQGNGCDQFHPWLTVAPDGSIAVVFLDRRLDPGNLLMDLYMTTSTDAGTTWSANERITTVSSDPTAGQKTMLSGLPREAFPIKTKEPHILAGRAGLLGEYIGVAASSVNDIHPMWTDTRLGDQDAFTGYETEQAIGEEELVTPRTARFSISPEPVSSHLEIVYEIPQHHPITLTLYDVCGRNIREKTISVPSKKGRHCQGLEALPRGTYFLTIEAGSYIKTFTVHKVK